MPMVFQTNQHTAARQDFHRARSRAALELIIGRLSGKSVELLSFEEVCQKLNASNQIERGARAIPLDAIVGSVGRYTDFSRTFLPRLASDADRWASVRAAATDVTRLPAIEVYQIGQVYFVLDGHHRVSIARRQGMRYIDAQVIEVETKLPITPDIQPDELIIKAEYTAFLEYTRLDHLRPGADLTVSVPGQYAKLENHIEVHRFFLEEAENVELCDEDAVCCWYDQAFSPMITAIRQAGILRYFPGRTETDFYIWLATHQAMLRNELGWQIKPQAMVKLAAGFAIVPEQRVQRMKHRVLKLIIPSSWKSDSSSEKWSQEKLLERYSQNLFTDILVPVGALASGWAALEQALVLAQRENAQLCGLRVVADQKQTTGRQARKMQQVFTTRCQRARINGNLALEAGDLIDKIEERVVLTDLLVLEQALLSTGHDKDDLVYTLQALVQQSPRPVMVLSNQVSQLNRILLLYGGGAKANEALFVATYMAEEWGISLAVLGVEGLESQNCTGLRYASKYLTMHEVAAEFLSVPGPLNEAILLSAADHACDLIIMGSCGPTRSHRRSWEASLSCLLQQWDRPVLICP